MDSDSRLIVTELGSNPSVTVGVTPRNGREEYPEMAFSVHEPNLVGNVGLVALLLSFYMPDTDLYHGNLPVSSERDLFLHPPIDFFWPRSSLEDWTALPSESKVEQKEGPTNDEKLESVGFPPEKVPKELRCSMGWTIMTKPVYACYLPQYKFEYKFLKEWIGAHKSHPCRPGERLNLEELVVDTELQNKLNRFTEEMVEKEKYRANPSINLPFWLKAEQKLVESHLEKTRPADTSNWSLIPYQSKS